MTKIKLDRKTYLTGVSCENVDTDYVNIDPRSKSVLGAMLSQVNLKPFHTVFGVVRSMKRAMDYVTNPGYPKEFLTKVRVKSSEIPRTVVSLPNYWAIVAYLLCEKITQDTVCMELMIENKLPYLSVSLETKSTSLGDLDVVRPNVRYGSYVGIIRVIDTMLKENRFDTVGIRELVNGLKDSPELPLFTGTTIYTTGV